MRRDLNRGTTMARIDATRQLCEFLAGFRWSEVPDAVIEKMRSASS